MPKPHIDEKGAIYASNGQHIGYLVGTLRPFTNPETIKALKPDCVEHGPAYWTPCEMKEETK